AREQTIHVVRRPTASSDLDERPDEIPYHMMEETVRRDPELHTEALPPDPLRRCHVASIATLFLTRLRERAERVVADQDLGALMQQVRIEVASQRPAPPGEEW